VAHAVPSALRLYDTRRQGIFAVESSESGPIGLYVCGITPYDTTHLGHAFTYLAFDVVHRFLEYLGHDVRYVQNLTDVDDDMLAHARDRGEDYVALGNRQAESFLADMAALNWLPPDVYARATEHVPQMVDMVERLLTAGRAYRGDGHVYLSVADDPGWGALSHVPKREQLALANERGNRLDLPGKRDPLDPVLWQVSLPDEPSWPSPWGDGRPGWHIECSAMSVTHLGPKFAIHGGGRDLAFPHHEAERLQSEGATGVRPVVGHWAHTGMVHYAEAKMSKSIGNLVMVADLLRQWSADAIRLALISQPYRVDLTWTDDLAASAHALVGRWTEAVRLRASEGTGGAQLADLPDAVAWRREEVLSALANDLDTPGAIQKLNALAGVALGRHDDRTRQAAGAHLHDLATRILGLRLVDG
jgi:L-cysteine:1D-myo-inositol 2-amino-2-deoxy-alpha-D-glucopyranoside ligase